MKNVLLVFLLIFCAVSFAQNAPLERLGRPFGQTNINLVWDAPTNDLPRALWVYRILPAEVSPTVISNLIKLGSFTDKDRKKVTGYPRIISYADSSGKKTL